MGDCLAFETRRAEKALQVRLLFYPLDIESKVLYIYSYGSCVGTQVGLQIQLHRDRHLDGPLGEPNDVGYLLCKEPWETTYPTQTFVHLLY